jgi:nicotinate-nucleotide adenylyltransferase
LKLVGLFGGTFDPIHNGHVVAANAAADKLNLEKVIFVPAGNPYFKTREGELVTCSEDRLKMVELAVEEKLSFDVSDIEIRREGPSFTLDTVRQFKEVAEQLVVIIGIDALVSFADWYKPEALLEECRILAVTRSGANPKLISRIPIAEIEKKIELLDVDTPNISSTKIRQLVRKGLSLEGIVPQKVIDYINQRQLYIG